jgi:hypothetical protein
MAFGVWHTDLENFSSQIWLDIVGEIEQQLFCQILCVTNFSLGDQSLVKSTPGLTFSTILAKNVCCNWDQL